MNAWIAKFGIDAYSIIENLICSTFLKAKILLNPFKECSKRTGFVFLINDNCFLFINISNVNFKMLKNEPKIDSKNLFLVLLNFIKNKYKFRHKILKNSKTGIA